jgi:exodeoxyribonuclease VII large subunit
MQNTSIYTVTELNSKVKLTLESEISYIGVSGEISNLVKAGSGHYYFTLKDNKAQIRCAFFSGHQRKLTQTQLNNGQQVLAFGKVSLYEPRGDYQLIVSHIQDAGLGMLYQQYLQLKSKLELMGLFGHERKKDIPQFPKHIAIITSPSGAAIHDIMTTIHRRYPLVKTTLYASEVQGVDAPRQLKAALENVKKDAIADVILLARGGGSIEDLWAFNDEQLALTISNCTIPIVTGIGHETDFTIADFVADYRAATPTAAAEKVTPNQYELHERIRQCQHRLLFLINKKLNDYQKTIEWFYRQLSAPEKLLVIPWQRTDLSTKALMDQMDLYLQKQQHRLNNLLTRLQVRNPTHQLQLNQTKLTHQLKQLLQAINHYVQFQNQRLSNLIQTLSVIGPDATLSRGYAIVTYNDHVITQSSEISIGADLIIQLHQGKLNVTVNEIP